MRRSRILVAVVAGAVGCSTQSPPGSVSGTGRVESISGQERIGWNQPADNAAQLAALHFVVFVDGARSEILDVTCTPVRDSTGTFPCSGNLPPLSHGTHKLELATFTNQDGKILESARSFLMNVRIDRGAGTQ